MILFIIEREVCTNVDDVCGIMMLKGNVDCIVSNNAAYNANDNNNNNSGNFGLIPLVKT